MRISISMLLVSYLLLAGQLCFAQNEPVENGQSVSINIRGRESGGYTIGATVQEARARQLVPMLPTALNNQLSKEKDKDKNKPTASNNPLLDKLLDKEADHHHGSSSGSSSGSGSGSGPSAKDWKKGVLNDLLASTSTPEEMQQHMQNEIYEYIQNAIANSIPFDQIQNTIDQLRNEIEQMMREGENQVFEDRLAAALGELNKPTRDAIERAIRETPDPPKPPIDPNAPVDEQRNQAYRNNDFQALANLARQETGGNLRKERDNLSESMQCAANVAGDENATPAEREAARRFAANLANAFNGIRSRTPADDPLLIDSLNILAGTCDNIAHWTEPPW